MSTSAGLKGEAKMQKLTFLSLTNTKITDAGPKHLAKLEELGEIYLEGTQVTKAGVDKLYDVLSEDIYIATTLT